MTQKTVSFHTLGCRLNFSETGSIADQFQKNGYQVVAFEEKADVVFLNTCTVTDGADSTCRNMIRKAQKFSPEGKIIVAGCYAQMESEKIKKMQGVDLVLGNSEKYKVFDYLNEDESTNVQIDLTNEFWGAYTSAAEAGHTRAFLKIQDGCNYICSYCIIPFARGRSKTISIAQAKVNAQTLVNQGFKEIILTGVNIGEYESKSGEKLTELIEEITSIPGVERLRLSSVEPNTITEDLLITLKNSGIYQDHFHIPLQSGDDDILQSMRRKYDVNFYRKTINLIKDYFPTCGIGADVIVGYPGETDEQFMNTYKLLEELPITHFHVFPYSKRKGTTAAKMDNHIQNDEKKRRVNLLLELGERKLAEFGNKFLNQKVEVLTEGKKADGSYQGYTSQFLKVRLPADENLSANSVVTAQLLSFDGKTYLGAIC